MNCSTSLLDYLNTFFEGRVYYGIFPQQVKLDDAVPNILITNIFESPTKNKDFDNDRDVLSYRIEIIGSNYAAVIEAKETIRDLLNEEIDNIYLLVYNGSEYILEEEIETHRIVMDYDVFKENC